MATVAVRIGSKGRMVLPKEARDRLDVTDGDIVFVDTSDQDGVVRLSKAESPLLRHLAESRADYDAGRFQTVEALAEELGVDLGRA